MSFLGGVLLKAITFELKTGYASANVLDLLEQKGLYLDWIAQARASCRGAGTRYWAVVHRRPQSKEPLLIAPANLFLRLCQGVPNNAFTFDCGGEKIVICKLKWLFWCKPEQVKYQIHKLLIREKERHAKRQEQK